MTRYLYLRIGLADAEPSHYFLNTASIPAWTQILSTD
jgi:hypothetical protein